jgi:polysaccharide biosynthesis/export protein
MRLATRAEFAAASGSESPEMKVMQQPGSLVAVGLLTLQLVMVARTQEIAPRPHGTAMANLAMERSPNGPGSSVNIDRTGEGTTNPGKADDTGDPALGGERHPLYRLSRLDVVEVNFTLSPEFNQNATVAPDGFISLRAAGNVFAEGLTAPELRLAIARAYAGILHEPEVTVTLRDFQRPYFLASGEVARPGRYEMRGDLTLSEAVAIAGGLTERAKHSQVVLFRHVSAEVAEARVVDLKKMLNHRNLNEDAHLVPGDFVYVPQNRISKMRKYVPTNSTNWYLNPLQF